MDAASLVLLNSYETLHAFTGGVLWHNDTRTRAALRYTKDLLQCRLQEYEEMVAYLSDRSGALVRDPALWKLCEAGCCHHPTLVEAVCGQADIVVSKVTVWVIYVFALCCH